MANNSLYTIRAHLRQAHGVAFKELERRARVILSSKRNRTASFAMGMGVASFYTWDGILMDELAYMNPVFDMLTEFDSELKLTGTPLRLELKVDGSIVKITDW